MAHDQDHDLCSTISHTECNDPECTDRDARTDHHGLMSAADKIKLETIQAGAGAPTKEFWVLVARRDYNNDGTVENVYASQLGDFGYCLIRDTGWVRYVFHVPHDFVSLTEAVVVMIPDATETIQWDVSTDYGAPGEAYNTHSEQALNEQLAVTAGNITECDVSGVLSGIAASDLVGMVFYSDTRDLRIIGLRIKYA